MYDVSVFIKKKNGCVTRLVLYLVITLSDFAFQIPLLFLTNIHAVIICLDYLLQLIYKSETEPAVSIIMMQYTEYDRQNLFTRYFILNPTNDNLFFKTNIIYASLD